MRSKDPVGTFRARLSEALIVLGGTQKAAATKLGVSESVLSKWINGPNEPSISSLAEIAAKTGVSLDWLLGLSEHRTLAPSIPAAPAEDLKHLRARAARADDLEAGLAAIGRLVKESPGGMELLVEKLGRVGPGGSRER